MQDKLNLLNQISDELNKDLDLDNILQRIIDLTVSHFKANQGAIILLDENNRVTDYILQQKNISNDRANQIMGEVLTEGFAGWILRHQRGDIIYDTITDDRWYTYPDQPYTVRSVVSVPLTRRNRILGVLTINHDDKPNHFKPEDLPLLTAIGGQAAIAIENAQLFHQTELERAKLSAIINSTQDVIIVTQKEDHRAILLNPAAEKLLGVGKQTWIDKPISELYHLDTLLNLLQQPPSSENELEISDEQHLLASVTDVPDVGRLTLLHDVSALKALDKMKTEFITAFTHDLAAPLATVSGYANLMETDGSLNQQQREDLHAIQMSVNQMRNLVKDLLELIRIETLKNLLMLDVPLPERVQQTYSTFTTVAEAKDIELELHNHPKSLTIQGNPALISRAIDNLVENAIKYTKPQGKVTLKLQTNGKMAKVSVKDTGIGIPKKGLDQVFDKFFRAHAPNENEAPGSGLGLSIVKTIAERHGGTVGVESQVNIGSTFSMTLPISQNGHGGD